MLSDLNLLLASPFCNVYDDGPVESVGYPDAYIPEMWAN